ncbi:MAG: YbbR-like domain-containing protein [Velocimicrobium sp.]
MKEKITRNLGIKLLSIPLAAIIWIVIINIDDPISTKVISNVPVEILNESYITASGQVYDIVEGNTVSVTIRAKRSIRDKIRTSDLKVTADLAEITQFKRVEIVAECTKYTSDSVEVIPKPKMLTVTLEDIGTKTLPIEITTTGLVDSGYYVDSVKASPNMIEIQGAESTIDKVTEVRVSLDVSGHQENFSQDGFVPKVYDEKGREVDSTRITFSHTNIKVKATILPTKTVPIQVNAVGTQAVGYTIERVEFGPEQIELAGQSDILSKIYSLPIEINVDAISKDKEVDIDLSDYLPKNTKLVGDTKSIAVRITVGRAATKDLTLDKDTIDVQNLAENYNVSISAPFPTVSIMASGDSDLEKISAADLNAYIDLADSTPGTYNIPVDFEAQSEYQVTNAPSVTVVITEEVPGDETSGDSNSTPPPTDPNTEDQATN